jgi:hypothetical protein
MGTINYYTSDYITLGVRPYDIDDFKNDPDFIEEMIDLYGEVNDDLIYDYINDLVDDDRANIEHALDKWDFYYFHIVIKPGYYEGFSLDIENNFSLCFDSYEDKRAAQKEITGIKQFLLGCAGLGLVKCAPGWCAAYYNYFDTVKAINAAAQEMREEVRRTPTWKTYKKEVIA